MIKKICPKYIEQSRERSKEINSDGVNSNYGVFRQWCVNNTPEYVTVDKSRVIDYSKCQFFRDLCGSNRVDLKFRKNESRY